MDRIINSYYIIIITVVQRKSSNTEDIFKHRYKEEQLFSIIKNIYGWKQELLNVHIEISKRIESFIYDINRGKVLFNQIFHK